MIYWDELLKTALLGTERQRPPAPSAGAPAALAAVTSRLPAGQPDDAVLGAAAVVSTCRRAGFVPALDESVRTLPASDPNDLPQTSVRSVHHLRAIMAGERRDLFPEWAAEAAAAGRRAPDVMLPQLLDLARSKPDYRELLQPILGKRGQWLASQNPDWSFAADGADPSADGGDAEAVWQTGERTVRIVLLTRLRKRDPAQALSLIQSTWAQEAADDRAKFVTALSNGLSQADESFLESVLDDRGKEVRRAAAGLLTRLPGSQLVQRMTARAQPLLAWKPGKKPKVEVTLPAAPDKSGERDGLDPKPQQGRVGQKQGWLWQILACVPPATWSKQWRVSPAEIVAALRKHEFEYVLVAAWAQAAGRNRDSDWAEALITTEAATVLEFAGDAVATDLRAALPRSRRDALLRGLLDSTDRADDEPPALTLLRGADGPWGEKLTRAVIDRMRDMAGRAPDAAYWKTIQMLRDMAVRVPPSMLGELAKGWPEEAKHWDRWKNAVDEFLATVQFRRDMLEEIRK